MKIIDDKIEAFKRKIERSYETIDELKQDIIRTQEKINLLADLKKDLAPRPTKKANKKKYLSTGISNHVLDVLSKAPKGMLSADLLKAVNKRSKKKYTKKQLSNCLSGLRRKKLIVTTGKTGRPGPWKYT